METVSRPPSTSRVTVAFSFSNTIFEAKVACDQPNRAASICPVWLESSSIACLPRMTSCGASFWQIALRSFATARGCISSLLSTRIAQSAPIASAVRSVSWQACTPQDTAMISVATPASLRRTASSSAISSKGFMDILTLAVSTPLPSALTRTLTLKSTTRLTLTRTFMDAERKKLSGVYERRIIARRATIPCIRGTPHERSFAGKSRFLAKQSQPRRVGDACGHRGLLPAGGAVRDERSGLQPHLRARAWRGRPFPHQSLRLRLRGSDRVEPDQDRLRRQAGARLGHRPGRQSRGLRHPQRSPQGAPRRGLRDPHPLARRHGGFGAQMRPAAADPECDVLRPDRLSRL